MTSNPLGGLCMDDVFLQIQRLHQKSHSFASSKQIKYFLAPSPIKRGFCTSRILRNSPLGPTKSGSLGNVSENWRAHHQIHPQRVRTPPRSKKLSLRASQKLSAKADPHHAFPGGRPTYDLYEPIKDILKRALTTLSLRRSTY